MHRGMKLLHLMTSTNVIDSRAADREGPRICLPQDYAKALELWKQSGELGHTKSYSNLLDEFDFPGICETVVDIKMYCTIYTD